MNELKTYDPNLLKKTIWIALNKKDTLNPEDESNLANLLSKTIGDLDLQCQGVISISGFTGNQTDTLLGMIANEMSGSED